MSTTSEESIQEEQDHDCNDSSSKIFGSGMKQDGNEELDLQSSEVESDVMTGCCLDLYDPAVDRFFNPGRDPHYVSFKRFLRNKRKLLSLLRTRLETDE